MSNSHRSVAFEGPSTPEGVVYVWEGDARSQEEIVESREFINRDVLDVVRGLPAGGFMLAQGQFPDIEDGMAQARFITHDELAYGRQESQRGVMFGQMVLQTLFDKEKADLVAVKPFRTAREAVKEYGAMTYTNSQVAPPGAYSTYEPIGFYAVPETGETALISRYDPTVISFDNLFWDEERQPSMLEAQKALMVCGQALGNLHAQGLSFGDSTIKNFAQGNVGVRYIDLESENWLPTSRGRVDPLLARPKVEKDLSWLFNSLNAPGTSSGGIDYGQEVLTGFMPAYTDAVTSPDSILPEELHITSSEAENLFY